MSYYNSFYLCLLVLCYLQTTSSKRLLYRSENDFSSSVITREAFSTNRRSFHLLNYGRDVTIKTTPASDSITSPSDRERNAQTQFDSRAEVKTANRLAFRIDIYKRKHFGFVTDQPLLKSSINRNANSPVNGEYHYLGGYDVIPGITEMCRKQDDCSDLRNSFCGPPMEGSIYGKCECEPNFVNDGEECIEEDDARICSTHEDCGGIEKGRCTFHFSTKRKICKCEQNFVAAKHQCLPKVQYLGECISSKQCSMHMQCLTNVCRHSCNDGYTWKHDTCMKDLPDILPKHNRSDDLILWQIVAPICIVCGVAITALFITLVIIFRRRLLQRGGSINANSPQDPRRESSSSSNVSSHFDPICDQPPPYNEAVTNSTLTLIENAEDIAEDPPPSYKSWEEHYSNNSAFKR